MWSVRRRPAIAATVTTVAISLPCIAWYIAGSAAAHDAAEELIEEPRLEARQEAQRLAEQLENRLESMLHSESKRPYKDYIGATSEFLGDCSYELRIDSSLAEGPADPLIWTHFQLDEFGRITLPTLGGERRGGADAADSVRLAVTDELECAASHRLAALRDWDDLSEEQWLNSPGGPTRVGPFRWFTISVREQPALVALRIVRTPSAVLTQGFVVLAESMLGLLTGSPYPVSLHPGEPTQVGEAILLLDEERWTVRADAAAPLDRAERAAAAVRRRFHLGFGLGVLGAALAGAVLVALVWQSDRLAQRRAQFAASAAHELRTPLAGLQLYGEMLAENIGDPGKRVQYARRIADEADRLGRVVTNVLGYSRLERGGLQVKPQPGDLAAAVRQSVAQIRPSLEAKGVQLSLEVAENVSHAVFDRDALHQILINLVDNAEKYTRAATDRTIEIRLADDGGRPVLSVIDHGAGVAPELRARLFEPFTRTTDPDQPAGLGIGLALVKALAAAQAATVSYRDAQGGGSCFTVAFVTG
jgi:signal transduction histidine kinase